MICRALMHEPRLLILDEPTTGLDPQSRLFLWDAMSDLRERGVTLMLTTHDMVEADRLCDRIAIVDHGKIIALDTPRGLRSRLPAEHGLELVVDGEADPSAAFERLAWVERVESQRINDRWTCGSTARRRTGRRRARGGRGGRPRGRRAQAHRGHARGRLRPPHGPGAARMSATGVGRTFLALCGRDLWVTVRHDPIAFLAQALLQPVFFLFVFGRVLPEIGAAQGGYGTPAAARRARAHARAHLAAEHRAAAGDRVLVHQGDRGSPARAAAGLDGRHPEARDRRRCAGSSRRC